MHQKIWIIDFLRIRFEAQVCITNCNQIQNFEASNFGYVPKNKALNLRDLWTYIQSFIARKTLVWEPFFNGFHTYCVCLFSKLENVAPALLQGIGKMKRQVRLLVVILVDSCIGRQ